MITSLKNNRLLLKRHKQKRREKWEQMKVISDGPRKKLVFKKPTKDELARIHEQVIQDLKVDRINLALWILLTLFLGATLIYGIYYLSLIL